MLLIILLLVLLAGVPIILYLKGYRLVAEDHLDKLEKQWQEQVIQENELLYADDLLEFRAEIHKLETDLDQAVRQIDRSDRRAVDIFKAFQTFLNELIQHSHTEDFNQKYRTKKNLTDYYNDTMKKSIELVSTEFKIIK